MTNRRYSEEFKIKTAQPVPGRGHKINDVADRLGTNTKSLYSWTKCYVDSDSQHQTITDQQQELCRLKPEILSVTVVRDMLKETAVYFLSGSKRSARS